MDVTLIQPNDYGDRLLPVDDTEAVIGREPTCNLRLEHGKISPRHCRIYRRGVRVFVEDLGSTAGTAVNGRDLETDAVELHDGDDLRIGPWHFRVAIDNGSGSKAFRTQGVAAARSRPSPSDSSIISPAVESARQMLENLTGRDIMVEGRPSRPSAAATVTAEPKTRLQVDQTDDGVTLARIVPRTLIDDAEIRRVDDELGALIDAGRTRLVLCFGNVEHLSSQAIGSVIRAHRRCGAGGGLLKVCAPHSQVAEVFTITNLQRLIEIHPDEASALRGPWPVPGPARPKPAAAGSATRPAAGHPPSGQAPARPAEPAPTRVRLRVMVGRAQGQFVEVRAPRFLIGRDTRCQLRPNSETVSRVHTVIEQRDGRVYVRDCGTVNGTLLGEQTLHAEEREALDGDRLQVGTLVFTFAIEAHHPHHEPADPRNPAIACLLDEHDPDPDSPTRYDLPTMPPAEDEPGF